MIRTIQSVHSGKEFSAWLSCLDKNGVHYSVVFEEACRILYAETIAVVWVY